MRLNTAVLDDPAKIRRTALDLLARREHSRVELARKLQQRGAMPELLEPILDRLAEQGLLSDTRYLESMIRKRAQAGYGPLRIQEELQRQGIPSAEVRQALQNADCDWAAQLEQVWRRKFDGVVPIDAKSRAKQARFLSYRGFPSDWISALWRGCGARF